MIRVILVGYGNIGRSILNYPGFEKANIRICAAFDIQESKVDRKSSPPVLPVDELGEFIRDNDVKIAVLAVPEYAAQKMMNRLVEDGIEGVLNFTPVVLKAPNDVFINDIDLVQALETIIFYTHSPLKNLG
jgi:redox-sensing transcriptional repressor